MRSKTTRAVWRGVGESTARESESAKCRYLVKSAWRTPPPILTQRTSVLWVFLLPRLSDSETRYIAPSYLGGSPC